MSLRLLWIIHLYLAVSILLCYCLAVVVSASRIWDVIAPKYYKLSFSPSFVLISLPLRLIFVCFTWKAFLYTKCFYSTRTIFHLLKNILNIIDYVIYKLLLTILFIILFMVNYLNSIYGAIGNWIVNTSLIILTSV